MTQLWSWLASGCRLYGTWVTESPCGVEGGPQAQQPASLTAASRWLPRPECPPPPGSSHPRLTGEASATKPRKRRVGPGHGLEGMAKAPVTPCGCQPCGPLSSGHALPKGSRPSLPEMSRLWPTALTAPAVAVIARLLLEPPQLLGLRLPLCRAGIQGSSLSVPCASSEQGLRTRPFSCAPSRPDTVQEGHLSCQDRIPAVPPRGLSPTPDLGRPPHPAHSLGSPWKDEPQPGSRGLTCRAYPGAPSPAPACSVLSGAESLASCSGRDLARGS